MSPKRKLVFIAEYFLILWFAVPLASAGELAKPMGDVILTVSGNISNTNAGGEARFGLDMLAAPTSAVVRTKTPWTPGVGEFVGVSLNDLIAAVGAKGKTLKATALNEYAIDLPASDAVPAGPIVAYSADGAPMSVRDKGPSWIMYTFDANASYRTEVMFSRSIWQLWSLGDRQ